MPAPPLKVAIIGAGRMGRQHAKAVAGLAQLATVVAVVDPDEGARRSFKDVASEARPFATLDELLAHAAIRPDVIHVCTAPAETHAAQARRALEAGAHIYVEKPFVDDLDTAREILTLARSRDLKVCCGYQLLFQEVADEAAAFIESPGSTIHLESFFAFKPRRTGPEVKHRISVEEQLFDILPHPTYLLLDLLRRSNPSGVTEIDSLSIGESGSIHAVIRRGASRGVLCVSLDARPVESTVRIIRSNGRMEVDFMRGTAQRLQGAGTSALQKVLDPFRWAWQLTIGTAVALLGRLLGRQGGYLGLSRLIEEFYVSIRRDSPPPISPELILDTEAVSDATRDALRGLGRGTPAHRADGVVCVTGGTGFLGRAVVRELTAAGRAVRVVSRRQPPAWERMAGVEYVAGDLGDSVPASLLAGCACVVHLAAATAGGYEEHRRDSIDATRNLIHAAADAGVQQLLYVSSLAVIDQTVGGAHLDEDSPLLTGKEAGPYAWGKAMAERECESVGGERGMDVRIVRPGPIVDFSRFDPPGRLGRWVGSWFVAVGPANAELHLVDVRFLARTLVWVAEHFEDAPPVLHALSPNPPSRRELVALLRAANPGVRVAWLPRPGLRLLSAMATLAQRVLRPSRPPISLATAFSSTRYDLTRIQSLGSAITQGAGEEPPDGESLAESVRGSMAAGG